MGKGGRASMPSPDATLPNLHVVTKSEALNPRAESQPFLFFYGGFFTYRGMID